MRRHLPALAVAVILGACTFPGVSYETPDGASPLEGSIGDDAPVSVESGEAGDATTGKDATLDSSVHETSLPDALPPGDAYVFEAAPDAPPCDQDEDTFLASGACGGMDCDDHDPRAYPGEMMYLTAVPSQATMGDWNCNHVIEKLYPTKVNCAASIANCDSVAGFTDDPPCGTLGTFVQCMTMNVIFCVEASSSMQLQACR
jgi:hypothetical protein